ncbi:MAG: GIY-YIG nuclease family protein [Endomicrobium sp.]|jgi:putative endonuclease|nr:GIY-YIG nuclease family protein [Endomicrobium sp.]
MNNTYYVYILASDKNGTLYTGVTNKVMEHKTKQIKGFTNRYNIDMLVWFESGGSIEKAIELEKKIKNRGRQWKIDLIEKKNPDWKDLSEEWAKY